MALRAHAEQQDVERGAAPGPSAAAAASSPAYQAAASSGSANSPSDGGIGVHPRRSGTPTGVEQRPPGALLVALVVVGGHEALVAPPDVHAPSSRRSRAPARRPGAATCSRTAVPTPPPVSTTDAVPCTACAAASRATSASATARASRVGVRLDDDVRAGPARQRPRSRLSTAVGGPCSRLASCGGAARRRRRRSSARVEPDVLPRRRSGRPARSRRSPPPAPRCRARRGPAGAAPR